MAAVITYRSLLHWKAFEAERTNVFDRITAVIGSAIEGNPADVDLLAYWLSNCSALLFLLQRTLKAGGTSGGLSASAASTLSSSRSRKSLSAQQSFFGRMSQVNSFAHFLPPSLPLTNPLPPLPLASRPSSPPLSPWARWQQQSSS